MNPRFTFCMVKVPQRRYAMTPFYNCSDNSTRFGAVYTSAMHTYDGKIFGGCLCVPHGHDRHQGVDPNGICIPHYERN